MTPEQKIKGNLKVLLKKYKVLATPYSASMYARSGFPDYICYTENKVHFLVEVKSATGRLSPSQKMWREQLIEYGQHYFLYKGDDEELENFLQNN